jgi:hypothetical protein
MNSLFGNGFPTFISFCSVCTSGLCVLWYLKLWHSGCVGFHLEHSYTMLSI